MPLEPFVLGHSGFGVLRTGHLTRVPSSNEQYRYPGVMKIDASEEERDLIVEALEHMFAYTRAASRDDMRYKDLADALRTERRNTGRN